MGNKFRKGHIVGINKIIMSVRELLNCWNKLWSAINFTG